MNCVVKACTHQVYWRYFVCHSLKYSRDTSLLELSMIKSWWLNCDLWKNKLYIFNNTVYTQNSMSRNLTKRPRYKYIKKLSWKINSKIILCINHSCGQIPKSIIPFYTRVLIKFYNYNLLNYLKITRKWSLHDTAFEC